MSTHPPDAGLALVADIGGTNARFALTDLSAPRAELRDPRSLPTADYDGLQEAAQAYLAGLGVAPRRACIAVAATVDAHEIRMTNIDWICPRDALQRALGLDELRVINDFGAIAWAVPELGGEDLVTLHGRHEAPPRGPVSVIGPGTGLGVGLLVGDTRRGWQVVETEGGHLSFAPLSEEERRIERWLAARFDRASTERVLSGPGLSHIHAVLAGDPPTSPLALRDPADIVGAALHAHEPLAQRTLARFCAVLGSVAGDLALAHGARTVMLAGGILPRIVDTLRASAFRERFLAKGRFAAYLEPVAIHLVTHPHPGLLGAAVALRASSREQCR